jgi:hypothetical protein
MSLVYQELKILNRVKGDIGLEIEVEGNALSVPKSHWRVEHDGSLQGESCEYVLDVPSTLDEAIKALTVLDDCWKRNGTVIHDAVRAGVHVHINCQNLTIKELYNFIVLFLVLENVLTKFCGNTREGNLFCLRSKDADFLLHILTGAIKNRKLQKYFQSNDIRYSALNVKALADYGSLEFRAMRSNRDLTRIAYWAELLLRLREKAKTFKDPTDIIQTFSIDGAEKFLKDNIYLPEKILELYPNVNVLKKDLFDGMRNAQDVAYCVEDWEGFKLNMIKIGQIEFPDDGEPIIEPNGDF